MSDPFQSASQICIEKGEAQVPCGSSLQHTWVAPGPHSELLSIQDISSAGNPLVESLSEKLQYFLTVFSCKKILLNVYKVFDSLSFQEVKLNSLLFEYELNLVNIKNKGYSKWGTASGNELSRKERGFQVHDSGKEHKHQAAWIHRDLKKAQSS